MKHVLNILVSIVFSLGIIQAKAGNEIGNGGSLIAQEFIARGYVVNSFLMALPDFIVAISHGLAAVLPKFTEQALWAATLGDDRYFSDTLALTVTGEGGYSVKDYYRVAGIVKHKFSCVSPSVPVIGP